MTIGFYWQFLCLSIIFKYICFERIFPLTILKSNIINMYFGNFFKLHNSFNNLSRHITLCDRWFHMKKWWFLQHDKLTYSSWRFSNTWQDQHKEITKTSVKIRGLLQGEFRLICYLKINVYFSRKVTPLVIQQEYFKFRVSKKEI